MHGGLSHGHTQNKHHLEPTSSITITKSQILVKSKPRFTHQPQRMSTIIPKYFFFLFFHFHWSVSNIICSPFLYFIGNQTEKTKQKKKEMKLTVGWWKWAEEVERIWERWDLEFSMATLRASSTACTQPIVFSSSLTKKFSSFSRESEDSLGRNDPFGFFFFLRFEFLFLFFFVNWVI